MKTKRKKIKHNYTSELELKSLLIRIINHRNDVGNTKLNSRINKYIKWHTAINNKKYDVPAKRNLLKNKLKAKIVELSEKTRVDRFSYERFGEIILLMIKNILSKPQFSGYTWKDDFYSDAVYKILKYLHNFNHKLISERTGQAVNAFAYISQYIHNSILYIIIEKNKDADKIRKYIAQENMNSDRQKYSIPDNEVYEDRLYHEATELNKFYLLGIDKSLLEEIRSLCLNLKEYTSLEIFYPKNYEIPFEEYNDIRSEFKGKISIVRSKT